MGLSASAKVALSRRVGLVDGEFRMSGEEIREMLSMGAKTCVFELQDHPDIVMQIHNVKLQLRDITVFIGDGSAYELFASGIEAVGIAPDQDGKIDAARTDDEINRLFQYWENGDRVAVFFDVTFRMPEWEEAVTTSSGPLNLSRGDFGSSSSRFEVCEGFDIDCPGSSIAVHSFRVSTEEGAFRE